MASFSDTNSTEAQQALHRLEVEIGQECADIRSNMLKDQQAAAKKRQYQRGSASFKDNEAAALVATAQVIADSVGAKKVNACCSVFIIF